MYILCPHNMGVLKTIGLFSDQGVVIPSTVLEGHLPGDLVYRSAHQDLHDFVSAAGQGTFAWIALVEPTAAELEVVREVCGLPDLQIADAVNLRQRPKIEVHGSDVFVIVKILEYVEKSSDVLTGQLSLFLSEHVVVTVQRGGHGTTTASSRHHAENAELWAGGPVSVLYACLDVIVDKYAVVIEEIEHDLAGIESSVFSDKVADESATIYRLKRENIEIRDAVQPAASITNRLVDNASLQVPDTIRPYLRDVNDHLLKAHDAVDRVDNLLLTMLMAANAQVQLQQNSDMRKISSYAAMAAVPTLIAGIYGMNFDWMPELHVWYGYPMALGLMAGIAGLMYRAFKKSGWL